MDVELKLIEMAMARIERVLKSKDAKAILKAMWRLGATSSNNRVYLTRIAEATGLRKQRIYRLIRGEKKHYAVLRGFVHYPDKGKRKGFYLLPAGRALAELLAEERELTDRRLTDVARLLAFRPQRPKRRQVPTKSPFSPPLVPTESELSPRFPGKDPNSLTPLNSLYSWDKVDNLSRANDLETSTRKFKGNNTKGETQPCARCKKHVGQLFTLNFVYHEALKVLVPEAVRYRGKLVCPQCYRKLLREVSRAWSGTWESKS